jgi:transposase InsO family protein
MTPTIQLQLLLATFAGWAGLQQSHAISYLIEENRVLKAQLESSDRRILFNDDQRRRLAAKGKPLGRRALEVIATIVTPDAILRWHRRLIAEKWTCLRNSVGRPGVMKEIRRLILQIAQGNPTRGYSRIQGGLRHLDHRVARSTVAKIMNEHGVEPAPERPMSWRTFVRSHAHLIAAADFFTTEVWTCRGLVTHYTLFAIDIATRRVHIAGTTTHPTSEWMEQIARNLMDCEDGFLTAKRLLIIDRDALFSARFKAILECSGIEILLTAYRAPNMNAFADRFVRSIKSECLSQIVFVEQASLDRAIAEFVAHYHDERSHQGIGNEIVSSAMPQRIGQIEVKEPLGGLLNYYHRRAA